MNNQSAIIKKKELLNVIIGEMQDLDEEGGMFTIDNLINFIRSNGIGLKGKDYWNNLPWGVFQKIVNIVS